MDLWYDFFVFSTYKVNYWLPLRLTFVTSAYSSSPFFFFFFYQASFRALRYVIGRKCGLHKMLSSFPSETFTKKCQPCRECLECFRAAVMLDNSKRKLNNHWAGTTWSWVNINHNISLKLLYVYLTLGQYRLDVYLLTTLACVECSVTDFVHLD